MLRVSIKQRPIKRRRQKVIKKHNQNVGDKRIDWNWNSKDFLIPFSSRQILLLDWIIWLLNVLHRSRAVPQPGIPEPFHENMLLINKVRNLLAHHSNRWPQHTNTRDNDLLLNMIVAAIARPNWRQGNIPPFRVEWNIFSWLWNRNKVAITALNLSQKLKMSESNYCKCNTYFDPNSNIVIVYKAYKVYIICRKVVQKVKQKYPKISGFRERN